MDSIATANAKPKTKRRHTTRDQREELPQAIEVFRAGLDTIREGIAIVNDAFRWASSSHRFGTLVNEAGGSLTASSAWLFEETLQRMMTHMVVVQLDTWLPKKPASDDQS